MKENFTNHKRKHNLILTFWHEVNTKTWVFFVDMKTRTVVWLWSQGMTSNQYGWLKKRIWHRNEWMHLFYVYQYLSWGLDSKYWWCLGINVPSPFLFKVKSNQKSFRNPIKNHSEIHLANFPHGPLPLIHPTGLHSTPAPYGPGLEGLSAG